MKTSQKKWQTFLVIGAFIAASFAAIPGRVLALDQFTDLSNRVVPPVEVVLGMTSGDWSAAWWQWALTFESSDSPVMDMIGTKCGSGQSDGPVFFLAGTGTTDPVVRDCTIPSGKTLIFPVINSECSTVESGDFYGKNERDLRTCVSKILDGASLTSLKLTLDGVRVHDLRAFRAQSPVYSFTGLPADNMMGVAAGTSGLSVSDGYWVIMEPLPPGRHIIHFEGAITSGPILWSQNVTYRLHVDK